MLTIEEIKVKYGHLCSFALWKEIDINQKPKFGVGDISHFNNLENININRNFILVGLNLSGKGTIERPFSNFHNPNPKSHDYKIRYAVKGTIFSGAYMTDIIKDYEEVMSGKVMKYLTSNPNVKEDNIKSFENELSEICSDNPVIITFGNDCFRIVNKLKDKYRIFKVPHYSSCISKEKLRHSFLEISKLL